MARANLQVKAENNILNCIVCQNIKKLMKKQGYSQKEMAGIIGITTGAFANKLNGFGTKFLLLELKIIANELLITLDELVNETL